MASPDVSAELEKRIEKVIMNSPDLLELLRGNGSAKCPAARTGSAVDEDRLTSRVRAILNKKPDLKAALIEWAENKTE